MSWNMPDGATTEQYDHYMGYDQPDEPEDDLPLCVICRQNDAHDETLVCGSCEQQAEEFLEAQKSEVA